MHVKVGIAEAGAATVVEAKGSTAECKAVLRLGDEEEPTCT